MSNIDYSKTYGGRNYREKILEKSYDEKLNEMLKVAKEYFGLFKIDIKTIPNILERYLIYYMYFDNLNGFKFSIKMLNKAFIKNYYDNMRIAFEQGTICQDDVYYVGFVKMGRIEISFEFDCVEVLKSSILDVIKMLKGLQVKYSFEK